eukprot:Pgem_evm1s10184
MCQVTCQMRTNETLNFWRPWDTKTESTNENSNLITLLETPQIQYTFKHLMAKKKSRKHKSTSKNLIHRSERPCEHCGITSSCTWRPGPNGKGSLCNTCGFYYRRT